jgi:lysophospholipase L1-like esterase
VTAVTIDISFECFPRGRPPASAGPPLNWPACDKEGVLPHLKTVLAVAGTALAVAACSGTPHSGNQHPTAAGPGAAATGTRPAADPAPSPTAAAPAARADLRGPYVALGDSYTAGLGVPEPTGATPGCGQSTASYPHLVARDLSLKLTDMSCSSATIADLTGAQVTGQGTNPAQLSALSPGTALVTVSIGGNDIGIIGIVTKCAELDLVPTLAGVASGRTPCADYYTADGADQIQPRIDAVGGDLAATLTEIRQRAPRARVYVVGYPDLLPADGSGCAGALDITVGDIAFLDREEVRLNAVLRQTATAAGDGYVDTYTPSVRHDACAAPASRWLEPLVPTSAAAPLHPNAAGERGMAAAVLAEISRTG